MSHPPRRLAAAVLAGMLLGCGESATTTIPANPPPITKDESGKPKPPPTAAGEVKPIKAQP